jgi:hypothetical protein
MAWGQVVFDENDDEKLNKEENEEKDETHENAERYKKATWVLKNDTLSQEQSGKGLINYREYLNI